MRAIDIVLQSFKDLDVYDTVSRKTIPRGTEIIYSYIVFNKKYKIDPETKRNVFLKWKSRLVFDGSKQKSYEVTLSTTPSLPMIRTLLKCSRGYLRSVKHFSTSRSVKCSRGYLPESSFHLDSQSVCT
jgi:hypothetical protein